MQYAVPVISGPVEPSGVYQPAEFRVGQALSRALEVLLRNFATFALISAVATLPSLFSEWIIVNGGHPNVWLQVGLLLLLSPLCTAMIVFATFQTLRGRAASPAESAGRGLQRFAPVLTATLLEGIIEGLGLVLLVVPGLIAMVMLVVTLPACVVERLGPWASLQRSVELTRGFRWPIFGGLFLVGIVDLAGDAAIRGAALHPGTAVVYAVVSYLWAALLRAYQSVLITIIYHDLRVAKEGIDLDRIAAVFD